MLRAAAALVALTACYRYSHELRAPAPGEQLVTFSEHEGTWFNGFVGTGRFDAAKYCRSPVRTGLEVSAIDVIVSIATLLIYTPHTMSVTCARAEALVEK
jgi:hypothetical protein